MILLPPLTICAYSPVFREAFRTMLRESWTETYSGELGKEVAKAMTKRLSTDDLAGLVPSRDEQAVIALQDNEICGSAISAARGNITYLWGVYVLQCFQRQGIGRALLAKAVLAHSMDNVVEIFVLKSSIGAIKFYEGLGFKSVSENDLEILPGLSYPSMTMQIPASALV